MVVNMEQEPNQPHRIPNWSVIYFCDVLWTVCPCFNYLSIRKSLSSYSYIFLLLFLFYFTFFSFFPLLFYYFCFLFLFFFSWSVLCFSFFLSPSLFNYFLYCQDLFPLFFFLFVTVPSLLPPFFRGLALLPSEVFCSRRLPIGLLVLEVQS